MLPKLGKRDLTATRSWRPIALLSCLSKGLERLIARCLAWCILQHKVVHNQHIGAMPKRSAVDLVSCLVHDIEAAWDQNQAASLLTLDIKGAFNIVLANRLQLRLREQGWPNNLVYWVGSFMSGRTARVRLEGATTATYPLACGLPQGSPVSPILFMLYTEPLY